MLLWTILSPRGAWQSETCRRDGRSALDGGFVRAVLLVAENAEALSGAEREKKDDS